VPSSILLLPYSASNASLVCDRSETTVETTFERVNFSVCLANAGSINNAKNFTGAWCRSYSVRFVVGRRGFVAVSVPSLSPGRGTLTNKRVPKPTFCRKLKIWVKSRNGPDYISGSGHVRLLVRGISARSFSWKGSISTNQHNKCPKLIFKLKLFRKIHQINLSTSEIKRRLVKSMRQ